MRWITQPFQVLYSVYAFICFVLLLLLLMPFFFLASFFGRIKGGNLFYRLCSFWADAWLFLIGIRTSNIHVSNPTEERPCIFVANHISYLDIPMLVKVIREPIRVLGKAEMARIPIFGFVYRNAVVMVDRSSPEKRAKSVDILKKYLGRGISIFIFPEGTFNETDQPLKSFYDGAFRIALETNTPIQPVIFPDTVKRLHYRSIFSFTPGRCRAVFLPMVPSARYEGKSVTELKEMVYEEMEQALTRFNK